MSKAQELKRITRENRKAVPHKSDLEKKMSWHSHQYVTYVIKECEKRAKQGFGSTRITVDKTPVMFGVDEERNSYYDWEFVFKLLSQEGFSFNQREDVDHYDAITTTLVWDKYALQSSDKIGMCWK